MRRKKLSREQKTERNFKSKIRKKKRILRKSDGKCFYCGVDLTIDNMTKDHVYPKSKGGSSKKKNLVASCKECNQKKGDQIIDTSGMT